MINTITDGQPITYELLNQIIEQVNEVQVEQSDIKQIIEFYGDNLGRREDDRIKVACGSQSVRLEKGKTRFTETFKFPSNVGFDTRPYITATIVDNRLGSSGDGTSYATLTIVNLSKVGFDMRLDLVKAPSRNTSIAVHYIAVGPGARG